MSMNRIQFQPGLSMPEFLKQFSTEAQCEAELEQARWPQGFVCPCCAHTGHSVFKVGSHKMFQCQDCRHQTSLIAGTLFQSTKLPLTVWFLAIYLICQAKTGLSSLALKRYLNVSYPTAGSFSTSSWKPCPSAKRITPSAAMSKSMMPQCRTRR